VPGERANDREAHIIKGTGGKSSGCGWIGDRTYLGRSAACHESRLRVERFTLTVRQKSAAAY